MSCEEHVQTEEVAPEKKKNRNQKTADYKKKAKEFKVRPRPNTAMYEIYFEEGGQIPTGLTGAYTSQVEARRQVKMYEVTRRQYY